MYAVSANYGGLIARMLFQPIEISTRNLFASLCAPPDTDVGPREDKAKVKNGSDAKDGIKTASDILTVIMRLYAILSLLAFTLGPTLAPLLLRLVAGSRWSDSGAGEVLGTYCYYIPFLAVNGVSEAFVAATASGKDLRNQSLWMGVNFMVFAASAWVLLRSYELGAKGLVLANCVNMAMRIGFNMSYIKQFFGSRGSVSTIDILAGAN